MNKFISFKVILVLFYFNSLISNELIELEKYGKIDGFEYNSEYIAVDNSGIYFSVANEELSKYKIIKTDNQFEIIWESKTFGYDNSIDDFELHRLTNLAVINGKLNIISNINNFSRLSNVSYINKSIINPNSGELEYSSFIESEIKHPRSNFEKGYFSDLNYYDFASRSNPNSSGNNVWKGRIENIERPIIYSKILEFSKDKYSLKDSRLDKFNTNNNISNFIDLEAESIVAKIIFNNDEYTYNNLRLATEFREFMSFDNTAYAFYHNTTFNFPDNLIILKASENKPIEKFNTNLPFKFILNNIHFYNDKLILIGKSKFDDQSNIRYSVVAFDKDLNLINYHNWGESEHQTLNNTVIKDDKLLLIGNNVKTNMQDFYLAKFDLNSFLNINSIEKNLNSLKYKTIPAPSKVKDDLHIESNDLLDFIKIYDLNSNEIKTITVNKRIINLNLSFLKTGVYFIKLSAKNKQQFIKIIKN